MRSPALNCAKSAGAIREQLDDLAANLADVAGRTLAISQKLGALEKDMLELSKELDS